MFTLSFLLVLLLHLSSQVLSSFFLTFSLSFSPFVCVSLFIPSYLFSSTSTLLFPSYFSFFFPFFPGSSFLPFFLFLRLCFSIYSTLLILLYFYPHLSFLFLPPFHLSSQVLSSPFSSPLPFFPSLLFSVSLLTSAPPPPAAHSTSPRGVTSGPPESGVPRGAIVGRGVEGRVAEVVE